jgi:hypothetical protein
MTKGKWGGGVWVGLSSNQTRGVESSGEERPPPLAARETNLEGPRVTKEPGLTSVARVPHTDGRYAARTPLQQPRHGTKSRRRRWGRGRGREGARRQLTKTGNPKLHTTTRQPHFTQAPPTNLPPRHHTYKHRIHSNRPQQVAQRTLLGPGRCHPSLHLRRPPHPRHPLPLSTPPVRLQHLPQQGQLQGLRSPPHWTLLHSPTQYGQHAFGRNR